MTLLLATMVFAGGSNNHLELNKGQPLSIPNGLEKIEFKIQNNGTDNAMMHINANILRFQERHQLESNEDGVFAVDFDETNNHTRIKSKMGVKFLFFGGDSEIETFYDGEGNEIETKRNFWGMLNKWGLAK